MIYPRFFRVFYVVWHLDRKVLTFTYLYNNCLFQLNFECYFIGKWSISKLILSKTQVQWFLISVKMAFYSWRSLWIIAFASCGFKLKIYKELFWNTLRLFLRSSLQCDVMAVSNVRIVFSVFFCARLTHELNSGNDTRYVIACVRCHVVLP